jgi:Lar family restriction alleviation protein
MSAVTKRCPFCGSGAVVTRIGDRRAWAKCLDCETTGPVAKTEHRALEYWNKRASI